jgi:hypothetical protein
MRELLTLGIDQHLDALYALRKEEKECRKQWDILMLRNRQETQIQHILEKLEFLLTEYRQGERGEL